MVGVIVPWTTVAPAGAVRDAERATVARTLCRFIDISGGAQKVAEAYKSMRITFVQNLVFDWRPAQTNVMESTFFLYAIDERQT
ncbi:hypothetical protein GCM10007320_04690 [Pseudorhodoferax aquiterrae]|uniref:Uncharacterized protein n=1 Tax=Pseudorhodoferax aquiterrae TaxID=747304 RepID=A0ABQ3FVE8_9BURK|nr:hypothetical protein GCM10007320_04690 [Pseudorhodoferax aquiterrae]